MAASDATPLPKKNQAYRAVFPIWDVNGDLVTGAAGLDSEISKDQGTFADATNEATEIATSSGVYYIDLTAAEMNADCVAVKIKSTTTDSKDTVLLLYPAEVADPTEIWTHQLTEAYNTDGVEPTPAQALFVIMQALTENSVSGTTVTCKKIDGSTTAFTLTINSASLPTSVTRAT